MESQQQIQGREQGADEEMVKAFDEVDLFSFACLVVQPDFHAIAETLAMGTRRGMAGEIKDSDVSTPMCLGRCFSFPCGVQCDGFLFLETCALEASATPGQCCLTFW